MTDHELLVQINNVEWIWGVSLSMKEAAEEIRFILMEDEDGV